MNLGEGEGRVWTATSLVEVQKARQAPLSLYGRRFIMNEQVLSPFYIIRSCNAVNADKASLPERLRGLTRNQIGSACAGSSPAGCGPFSCPPRESLRGFDCCGNDMGFLWASGGNSFGQCRELTTASRRPRAPPSTTASASSPRDSFVPGRRWLHKRDKKRCVTCRVRTYAGRAHLISSQTP